MLHQPPSAKLGFGRQVKGALQVPPPSGTHRRPNVAGGPESPVHARWPSTTRHRIRNTGESLKGCAILPLLRAPCEPDGLDDKAQLLERIPRWSIEAPGGQLDFGDALGLGYIGDPAQKRACDTA